VRALALASVLLVFPGLAAAERRLHERVEDPARGEGPLLDQPAEGSNPAALRVGRREVPEPAHTEELGQDELPMDRESRTDSWRPDLATDAFPEHLQYTSTFEPSVSPFKRVSALDAVGRGYELTLRSRELSEVEVGGRAEPGRELFWGSVAVQLRPGEAVPVPSVAPGARILSVRARPDRPVRFYRDGADNYYVVGEQAGLTRLVFVTDAASSYFGGPLPASASAADVPPSLRPSLPRPVVAAARRVFAELALDPSAPMSRNLTRLVAYLRSFRPEPLEVPPGADRYVTLALGRRGVCRHRAFVFVVTAQALGIPARFVTNEAHAFAEAWIPGVGWRRVDLGGAGPLADSDSDTIQHEPQQQDPFLWPRGERSSSAPRTDGGRPASSGGESGSPGGTSGGSRRTEPLVTRSGGAAEGAVGEGGSPGEEGAEGGEEGLPPPERARVLIDGHSSQVIRGEALRVAGHVEGARGAVPGARVVVWLRRADGADAVRIGQTVAAGDGCFEAHMAVPADLPAGDYSLAASLAD